MPGSVTRRLVAAAAGLALAAGCGGGEDGGSDRRVRTALVDGDSVTVVESPGPAWGEGESWAVADTPSLVIGAGEGEGHALSGVAGAVRLPDGRIVVANGEPPELRFFGPDGRLLRRVGGEGEGPGEFRDLSDLQRAGTDSVVVLDPDLLRISVFDDSGGFRGSLNVEGTTAASGRPVRYYGLVGTVRGRGWLLYPSFPGRVGRIEGAYFDSVPAPVLAPDGSLAGTMGHFRMEMYNPPRVQGASLPFGRVTRVAAGPEGVWMGDGTDAEATLIGPSGDPVRVLRWGHEPPRVEARIDAWLERRLEGADPEERRRERQRIEQAPLPDRVPAYSQLVVDAGGRLWAERYRAWGHRGATRWDVLDPEEGWLGTVEVPRRLRVDAIGEDWILGRWRDELNVEHVLLFEIRKGGAAAR